jgi:hypothetical protein
LRFQRLSSRVDDRNVARQRESGDPARDVETGVLVEVVVNARVEA